MTRLSAHFTLEEMTASNTAARKGIANTLAAGIHDQLILTADKMEAVRHLLGDRSIRVLSGYRNSAVNKAVGGSRTSAHMSGHAVDFTCPDYGSSAKVAAFLAEALAAKGIPFDQLIEEFGGWVHIGFGPGTRRQLLTARKVNGKTVYTPGIG